MVKLFKQRNSNEAENEINFESFTKFALFMFRFVLFDFKPLNENASRKQKLIRFFRRVHVKACMIGHASAVLSAVGYPMTHSGNFVAAASSFLDALTTVNFIKLRFY